MAEVAIYYDSSKCTACKGCQIACKQWNQLPSDLTTEQYEFSKSYQNPLELQPSTWLLMSFSEVDKDVGIDWNFMRTACFHCTDAACEKACPVGAISKKDNGSVVIDQDKCIGCRYCVSACPFGVPHWSEAENKTYKCRMCQDRIGNVDPLSGEAAEPACVKACPTDALQFGPRSEMVALAQARVTELKAAGFNDAEVYGVDEMDGMHMIAVAHRGLEAHGLIRDPKVDLATDVWQLVKPLGGIAGAAMVGALTLSFITGLGYSRDEMTLESSEKGVE